MTPTPPQAGGRKPQDAVRDALFNLWSSAVAEWDCEAGSEQLRASLKTAEIVLNETGGAASRPNVRGGASSDGGGTGGGGQPPTPAVALEGREAWWIESIRECLRHHGRTVLLGEFEKAIAVLRALAAADPARRQQTPPTPAPTLTAAEQSLVIAVRSLPSHAERGLLAIIDRLLAAGAPAAASDNLRLREALEEANGMINGVWYGSAMSGISHAKWQQTYAAAVAGADAAPAAEGGGA